MVWSSMKRIAYSLWVEGKSESLIEEVIADHRGLSDGKVSRLEDVGVRCFILRHAAQPWLGATGDKCTVTRG